MERIEDRSKALSFIGIEVADALKEIPKPAKMEKIEENEQDDEIIEENYKQEQAYEETVVVEKKPSLWERIKNSKLVRTISYIMKIRVVLDVPALPEGRGENS